MDTWWIDYYGYLVILYRVLIDLCFQNWLDKKLRIFLKAPGDAPCRWKFFILSRQLERRGRGNTSSTLFVECTQRGILSKEGAHRSGDSMEDDLNLY